MRDRDIAQWFFDQLQHLQQDSQLAKTIRAQRLYELMRQLLKERTRKKELHFNTLFALIAYACQTQGIEENVQGLLQRFRYLIFKLYDRPSEQLAESAFALGWPAMVLAVSAFYQREIPETLKAHMPEKLPEPPTKVQAVEKHEHLRVLLLKHLPEQHIFEARVDDQHQQNILISYGKTDKHDLHEEFFRKLAGNWPLPLMASIEEVSVDEQGLYHPGSFILEPDYLLDVTAIAEATDSREPGSSFLLKKFLPFTTSKHLLLGHIANFFLDELMHNPDAEFKQLFNKTFKLNPLGFSMLDDQTIREIMQSAQQHYLVIKQMVQQGFAKENLRPEKSYLEPTFYSARHGLQGRLDVLYREGRETGIVELKSGRVFRPNQYGINSSHFTQTLLYDLMIRNAFRQTDPRNYILYSQNSDNPLRYAPPVKAIQWEAIQLRNELMLIERMMLETMANNPERPIDESPGARLLDQLQPQKQSGLSGFRKRDIEIFSQAYQKLRNVERHYFLAFSGFIAREHQLAKLGHENNDRRHGQAGLWRLSVHQKNEDHQILSHLDLIANDSAEEEPLLRFRRSESTNPLANFRAGDIVVLYPELEAPLSHQIFKCTLVEINSSEVLLRLRARQFNHDFFDQFQQWHVEHDLLDSSFTGLYRALFAFAQAPLQKRQLLLGEQAPAAPDPTSAPRVLPPEMTEEQKEIFSKLLQSRDYFLLWGPPGTGKTSIMLKALVQHLYENTDENILLLAYTNRAVDEICAAIESIGPQMKEQYLRIGSSYSTAREYRDRLLSRQVEKINNRRELIGLLKEHRIFLGTIASFAGRQEILTFKHFNRVIIDEASQILEPALMGLLPRFEHFTLIGDHLQLPAVVVQSEEASAVRLHDLNELGLYNMRNSLFERLYRRAREKKWEHAYARLSHQGRMHADIMRYPNELFYGGQLKLLPGARGRQQQLPLQLPLPENAPDWQRQLAHKRLLFIDCPVDDKTANNKTNSFEAMRIAEVLLALRQMHELAGHPLKNEQVGIITPYRAQIAAIRSRLEERGISTQGLTIDTVERLQGGARDLILISLCTNSPRQLETLSSLTEEGIDRKLNVAITRAREQIVLFGNREILSASQLYSRLIH